MQQASSDFLQTAQQASQYTDLQRGLTISSYEDSESVSTTQRTLVNNNVCYAVNYFVRKVLDVYVLTTSVNAITIQIAAANFVSAALTPAEISQLPKEYQKPVETVLKQLPTVGEKVEATEPIAVPTDGVVYDPELAHCCAQDPALEQGVMIRLQREQAEAQKAGLELQLMALEVQRRQALLAAGTLTAFEPDPTETIVASARPEEPRDRSITARSRGSSGRVVLGSSRTERDVGDRRVERGGLTAAADRVDDRVGRGRDDRDRAGVPVADPDLGSVRGGRDRHRRVPGPGS